ncbi:MAG: sporulation integral membrane protein YlbJ [Bacillota bacterium]|nr:sporulation integral membrane protein YlbJ [Bacillota bacterium]
MVSILCAVSAVSILVFILLSIKKRSINNILIFICSCILIYFITFPKQCINSTIFGTKIFFTSVFPSLFPFLIICNLLISYDGITIYSKLFGKILCKPLRLPLQCSLTIIISSLCGYPLGAKYCCEMYENNLISKEDCQRLLNIASNASPLFIVGSVGTAMLGFTNLGYVILTSNYISCLLMSAILKPESAYSKDDRFRFYLRGMGIEKNIGKTLKESIDNAIKSTLSIGGYIIFFSVIIDIINYNSYLEYIIYYITGSNTMKDFIKSLILGLIEITKGCQLISLLNVSVYLKCIVISFLLGFSGLSIISQVYSFTYRFPELSVKKYIKRKAVQGLFCSATTALLLVPLNYYSSSTVFNQGSSLTMLPLILMLGSILLIPLLLTLIKNLLHIS